MRGWAEDNVASNTLESAKAMVAQLRLDIDFGEVFVPGIRRGYAIVPYAYATRPGETEGQCQERLTGDEGPGPPTTLAELLDAS